MKVRFECDGCLRTYPTADAAGKCERSHDAGRSGMRDKLNDLAAAIDHLRNVLPEPAMPGAFKAWEAVDAALAALRAL